MVSSEAAISCETAARFIALVRGCVRGGGEPVYVFGYDC